MLPDIRFVWSAQGSQFYYNLCSKKDTCIESLNHKSDIDGLPKVLTSLLNSFIPLLLVCWPCNCRAAIIDMDNNRKLWPTKEIQSMPTALSFWNMSVTYIKWSHLKLQNTVTLNLGGKPQQIRRTQRKEVPSSHWWACEPSETLSKVMEKSKKDNVNLIVAVCKMELAK